MNIITFKASADKNKPICKILPQDQTADYISLQEVDETHDHNYPYILSVLLMNGIIVRNN